LLVSDSVELCMAVEILLAASWLPLMAWCSWHCRVAIPPSDKPWQCVQNHCCGECILSRGFIEAHILLIFVICVGGNLVCLRKIHNNAHRIGTEQQVATRITRKRLIN
jgi:hypothetical protein